MLKNPWRPVAQIRRGFLPVQLQPWLLDCGSLTRSVKTACSGRFRVAIVDQRITRPLREESLALDLQPGNLALVRQVFLLCDNTPWVYARSVIPLTTLRRARNHLGPLDTRPLGEVLFTDPTTVRGQVDIGRIPSHHPIARAALPGKETNTDVLWGRRSIFSIRGDHLLVAEVFLPALQAQGVQHMQRSTASRYKHQQRRCTARTGNTPELMTQAIG